MFLPRSHPSSVGMNTRVTITKQTINSKKAIFFYEKAFLCQEDQETFNDFVTAKVEYSGKIKTILYIITNKKLLQKIIKIRSRA